MSTNVVNCEEFELFLAFKRQIDTHCERYQQLSIEIIEKEKELLIRNGEFEESKKRTYEVLDNINKDIKEQRKELENLKKQHIASRVRLQIIENKICLLEKINQEMN